MDKLKNVGQFLLQHVAYTAIFVIALILFLYFSKGDFIAGVLTAVSALVAYVFCVLLCQEYKNYQPAKPVVKKVVAKKKVAKKSGKKK